MNEILKDRDGKNSSKRIAGSVILGIAILFSIILFWFSLTSGAKDPNTAISIINAFFTAGTLILGVGAFEKGIKK
jgi:hypothetical protein